jgi:hypothetical protein
LPAEQLYPGGQTFPHEPQFAASKCVLTHWPLQHVAVRAGSPLGAAPQHVSDAPLPHTWLSLQQWPPPPKGGTMNRPPRDR